MGEDGGVAMSTDAPRDGKEGRRCDAERPARVKVRHVAGMPARVGWAVEVGPNLVWYHERMSIVLLERYAQVHVGVPEHSWPIVPGLHAYK